MAAMGPEDRARPEPDGTTPGLPGLPGLPRACISTTHSSNKQTTVVNGHRHKAPCWSRMGPEPTTQPGNISAGGKASSSFHSPESVEMDEIMAAMVLTTLSSHPLVQNTRQTDPGPGAGVAASTVDMECGGGELSDSGSSGYWSCDHGNVSPAPETDSSPDEGLHMELDQGEEPRCRPLKGGSFRGGYRCLWPSCGKVLTSSVGIKRHIRVLHLCSGSDQTQREEDFYYTKTCSDTTQMHLAPPHTRPRALSQSAPSSFWQIHSEHLYQISVAPKSPVSHGLSPAPSTTTTTNIPMVKPRCRSVSVGEQWLQQNRLQPISAHCAFRKGRGEAKKCRKVYGVERKDEWCTACRWKKACQRFPD